jgi:hypothetical protein
MCRTPLSSTYSVVLTWPTDAASYVLAGTFMDLKKSFTHVLMEFRKKEDGTGEAALGKGQTHLGKHRLCVECSSRCRSGVSKVTVQLLSDQRALGVEGMSFDLSSCCACCA